MTRRNLTYDDGMMIWKTREAYRVQPCCWRCCTSRNSSSRSVPSGRSREGSGRRWWCMGWRSLLSGAYGGSSVRDCRGSCGGAGDS